jgi:hypothetical protein
MTSRLVVIASEATQSRLDQRGGAEPAVGGLPTGPANRALGPEGVCDYLAIPGVGHLRQIENPAARLAAALSFLAAHRIRA